MFQFGKLAIQSTVSTLGTVAIAAQAMTNILENLNGIAAIGIGIGLMTVVGQCLGAGRKDEAIYYIKKLSWLSEAVIIASCLLVFALTKPITMLAGMEPASAKLCFFMISFITIVKPVSWVLSFIPPYGMRAAGDVKFSMITSCCTMWLCRVSLCIYLCRVWGFGPIAVWIGMFSDWTLRAIIFSIRFHSRKWLNHRVIENDDIPFCDLPLHIFLRCCFSFYRMRQPFCLHAGQNCLILRHLHYHLFHILLTLHSQSGSRSPDN